MRPVAELTEREERVVFANHPYDARNRTVEREGDREKTRDDERARAERTTESDEPESSEADEEVMNERERAHGRKVIEREGACGCGDEIAAEVVVQAAFVERVGERESLPFERSDERHVPPSIPDREMPRELERRRDRDRRNHESDGERAKVVLKLRCAADSPYRERDDVEYA